MEKRFKINNEMAELSRVRIELEQDMVSLGFGNECRSDVHLICEEILCNIISYGCLKPGNDCMEMKFVFDGHSLTLEFLDNGIAFDPLNRPDPDLNDPDADDRPVGGLGIFLVKELSEQQFYERRSDKNHLTVKRSILLIED
jgi:serine/threonine-protein kinase RsbW